MDEIPKNKEKIFNKMCEWPGVFLTILFPDRMFLTTKDLNQSQINCYENWIRLTSPNPIGLILIWSYCAFSTMCTLGTNNDYCIICPMVQALTSNRTDGCGHLCHVPRLEQVPHPGWSKCPMQARDMTISRNGIVKTTQQSLKANCALSI